MARIMTSEIIEKLRKAVEKYGDLPFEICDADIGVQYADVSVYANTFENGGCQDEDETPAIGIQFQ